MNKPKMALLAIPLILAGTLLAQTDAGPAANVQTAAVYDYADQITRLVQNQKITELAKLNLPATDTQLSRLQSWTSQYVTEIQKQEGERDKQYAEAVDKATAAAEKNHFDEAMDNLVLAYQITKDANAFLQLGWVKDLTATVASKAADLEKQGNWIESLQLYTDLNSLYEIDTRYKPDMQRLARRTRLLALYTPKTLYEMRKVLFERQVKERAATNPSATQPTTQPDLDEVTNFPRWQDYVDGVTEDMMADAIERSKNDWVETTSYDTLVRGGVESLRLFLSTPELAKEFPELANQQAREDFAKALDGALAKDASGRDLGAADVVRIVTGLVEASNKTIKLPEQVVIMEFTDGAMERLDPFSTVIWPHEKDEFDKNTRGSFGGVGIQISQENQQLKVISPLEDTPAFKAGIEAGDVISGIDGKSTVGISIDQAVRTIMGAPGTQVTLRIKRGADQEKDYPLTRAIIKVASVKGYKREENDASGRWDFMLDQDNKIGYVRITGFQEDTADELRSVVGNLQAQGMRGLILDLRFNPGGYLNTAIDMCDMFLQDGVIVSTKGRSSNAKEHRWKASKDTVIPPNMPIVVLVNQYSASASEIFSGAMKDLHRALIVGHRSFGKGSVQNLLPLGPERRGDGQPVAEMKLTMAYYYLPQGESLHRKDGAAEWGVDPDVVVDLTPKQLASLLKARRDSDIIRHTPATAPATSPAETANQDTQLDTAILMMRLQLVQAKT